MKVREWEALSDEEKLELKLRQRTELINKSHLNWGEFNSLVYLNKEIKELWKKVII